MAEKTNAELKSTEVGMILYHKWLRTRKLTPDPSKRSDAFDAFADFYKWSMKSGFVEGAKLMRYDTSKPFSPENCYWTPLQKEAQLRASSERVKCIEKWDNFINRIRKAYGMCPLEEMKKQEAEEDGEV